VPVKISCGLLKKAMDEAGRVFINFYIFFKNRKMFLLLTASQETKITSTAGKKFSAKKENQSVLYTSQQQKMFVSAD
jgi:hypothetical protein